MGRKGLMLLVAAVMLACFVVGCASSKPWGADTIDESATKAAPKTAPKSGQGLSPGEHMSNKADALQAGTAWADVTPPAFTFMTGMGSRRPRPTGVHDRLRAKVLVLASGPEKVALVTVDLNAIDFDHVSEIRRLVERYTDIRGANVHVTASHSHSTPALARLWKGGTGLSRDWDPIYEEESRHVDAACRLIAGAVYEANLHLVDAEVGFESGTSKFNIVRWHLDDKGHMHYIPGHRERPANLDPLTGMFIMHVRERESKKSLAFYYTNSAHAICVCLQSTLITADYPAFVAETVEKRFGGLCLFAPGSIGDQHPRDFDRGFAAAEAMGGQLAGEIVKAQERMKYTSRVTLRSTETELDLPMSARENACDYTRTRLSVVALDDVALSFWPGEAFGMITRRLEAESPFARTVLVSTTDDYKYYFALRAEFSKHTWDPGGAQPGHYALDAGDLLLSKSLELLNALKKTGGAR